MKLRFLFTNELPNLMNPATAVRSTNQLVSGMIADFE
jgi:hypothetical protein